MNLAASLFFKVVMSLLVFVGTLKLVLAPRSVEPWDARALYRLRCGTYGVPFEYGMMTFLKRPTFKGISELVTCRSSTYTHLLASPGFSPVRADYHRPGRDVEGSRELPGLPSQSARSTKWPGSQ